MTTPYGYAGIYRDTVYAIGRSEAGMERDRVRTEGQISDTIELDSVVPCTRRAFDAVRAGQVQVHTERQADGRAVLAMIDGVLDVPRGRGRPAAAPAAPRTRTYGISIAADTHARVMALSDAERAGLALAVLATIERHLAG